MSFANPALLLLLPVLAVLAAWGFVRLERERRRALAEVGDPALLERTSAIPSPRRRLLRHVARTLAVAFGIVALARPQWGEKPADRARTGRDIVVALDLSRSMNAADVAPSRLAAAKQAIRRLVAARSGDRFGLIVFGGSAFVQLPLTDDPTVFERFLAAASTDDLGDPGTSLSAALDAAVTMFQHDGAPGSRAVVLVSDGESDQDDDVAKPLAALRRLDVPVYTLGVGTPEGAPVPADSSEAPEQWHRDHIGRIVVSHLSDAALARIAEATGGRYERWDGRRDAPLLAAALDRLTVRTSSIAHVIERTDRFQWPLGLVFALVLLEPLVPLRRRAT
jgi:Ca-activated chloride channel family protein